MSATTSGLDDDDDRPLGWAVAGGKLATALILSLVAGVAVALVALPAVTLVGLTAKGGANTFLDLPTDLKTAPLAQGSRVLDSQGHLIANLTGDEDREVVRLSHVAPVMRQAIVDIEDSRFYEHHGVDYKGTLRALVTNNENGSISQGGSTITQQYVKRVLLERATTKAQLKEATEQSVQRKLREARYALALEKVESKSQILENYLNIVFFGDGAYGVQTASKHYFGIDVSKLNVAEAATLAGLVQSPTTYDPTLHPAAALKRRNIVLFRMHQLHHLTDAAYKYAVASPLGLKPAKPAADSCQTSKVRVGSGAPVSTAFFCSWVRSKLLADPRFGATAEDRSRQLFEGNLTIKTSLDPVAQAAAQKAVDDYVNPGQHVAAGTVMIQPGTGKVLAMAIDRTYGAASDKKSASTTNDFNHTKNNMTLSNDAFSPGSTFKLFTLTAAIAQGLPLDTTFNSPSCYVPPADSPLGVPGNTDGSGGKGCYHNAEDSEGGNFSMTTATWNSVNTYFVQLEQKIGVLKARDMARRLGVTSPTMSQVSDASGSFTLGSYDASTLDMATAYATIAAHGRRCDPKPILSVTANGKGMPFTGPVPCKQAVSAQVADTVTSVLQGVITSGTGQPNGQIGRPAAGKTGTAEDHSDAWFIGYTPQLSTAVTVGDPRSTFNPANQLRNVVINGRPWSSVFGGDIPTQIWAQAMRDTLNNENLPVVQFALPQDTTQPKAPPSVQVPDERGKLLPDALADLQSHGFTGQVVQQGESLRPVGTVLLQSPGPNSKAPPGSVIKLRISKGFGGKPATPNVPAQTPTGPGATIPGQQPITTGPTR